ncbi:hypothetical protein ACIBH1_08870 [Nonomuraea sp. NPDC050663]|uniref:hypothetical protein n=1 Tax=Nonomuraea sp. NPDC050663 TaxID=3364370 RepID=UPI0037B20871
MLKNIVKTAVAGIGFAAATLAIAQPASASSFSWNVGDGLITYVDSGNRLCVEAYDSEGARWVEVRINGRTYRDNNNYYGDPGSLCWTLSLTENATYTATARSYWGERGTTISRGSRSFTA